MKKKSVKPEIELYMYSINQEFPVGKGHHTFLKRHSEIVDDVSMGLSQLEQVSSQVFKEKTSSNWSVQWIHNKWIENYTKRTGSIGSFEDPLSRLILRKENFGGIILDPANDRVFKVNQAGLQLMEEVIKAGKRGSLARFKSPKFGAADVEMFANFLKGAGLWK